MSQSATLYRISKEIFLQIEQSDNKGQFNMTSIAESYSTFSGTFCGGIEFVLSKGLDAETTELINEIFTPKRCFGNEEYDKLSEEKKFEFYERGFLIYYHDPFTVTRINNFLSKISESTIHLKYDANELNDNGIYPSIWHNDNSRDLAYNERHIAEDILELKKIFELADKDKNYILVFTG